MGVAKRLLRLQGLPPERQVRATAAAAAAAAQTPQRASDEASDGGWRPLTPPTPGSAPALWLPLAAGEEALGAALCCPGGGGRGQFTRPVYVSVGHRISLASALAAVQRCCRHRVPEPIRQADLLSRAEVRRLQQQEQRQEAAQEEHPPP